MRALPRLFSLVFSTGAGIMRERRSRKKKRERSKLGRSLTVVSPRGGRGVGGKKTGKGKEKEIPPSLISSDASNVETDGRKRRNREKQRSGEREGEMGRCRWCF